VLAAAVLAGPADARTFTVDSPQDQGDQNTTDGICDTDNFGCTLRAAVEQADAFVDDPSDTIVVPPGTYDVGNALAPTTNMQVVGASARTTVVHATGGDRVFNISAGRASPSVGISGVTLSNEDANANNGFFGGNLAISPLPRADAPLAVSLIWTYAGDGCFHSAPQHQS